MRLIQIQIPLGTDKPLASLEQKINDTVKRLMVYDVKLGICRNVEQMTIPRTNYSAMIIHSDYNSRNKIISVKLFDNSDIPVYGARKSLTDTVNKYLAGKELDPQDIEYVSIPIDYGHVNQIVMIKHRGDR